MTGPRSSVLPLGTKRASAGRRCRENSSSSVLDERGDLVTRELLAPFQSSELDEERETDDLTLELLHKLDRAGHGAAGGEQVVDDQHTRAGFHRVLVHLERRGAVLEVVLDAHHVAGQLAKFADRDESHAELVSDRRREDEPARLHSDDDVDLLRADLREQPVDRRRERITVLEERSNVLEEDPGLRKVGDVTDLAGETVGLYRHDTESSRGARTKWSGCWLDMSFDGRDRPPSCFRSWRSPGAMFRCPPPTAPCRCQRTFRRT